MKKLPPDGISKTSLIPPRQVGRIESKQQFRISRKIKCICCTVWSGKSKVGKSQSGQRTKAAGVVYPLTLVTATRERIKDELKSVLSMRLPAIGGSKILNI